MTSRAGGFEGFRPAAFRFLRGLARRNDPLWFKPRKDVYEREVLAPLRALVVDLGAALQAAGLPLNGNPARGIFRIYRDVRFSSDKRLYKTHAAAVLTRSGGKGDPGLLYIHVEPGRSLIGAGFWHPPPELLTKMRRAIVGDPDSFLAMAEALAAAGYPLGCEAERLARPPRGFDAAAGTPVADYVCWKNYLAETPLGDADLQSPAAIARIVGFARAVQPLLDWGWAAEADDIPPPLALKLPSRPLPLPDF
ncbi:MAG: DUF2461 domain-containing protein [Alphaproteobacteria bacterium]|nr:DUF2461 domain-containing protein [Alphaproteobacteria bacterium]